MAYARRATLAASITDLAPLPNETVPLADVLRHRQAFAQMVEAWEEETSLHKLLDNAAECVASGCNAPMAKILELGEDGYALIVKGQFGLGEEAVGRSAGRTDDPANPAGAALSSGKPVIDEDVRRRGAENLPDILVEHQVVTSVNLPLINATGAYGVVEVDYHERKQISAFEMSFLASVASTLAENIEKHRARATLAADRDAKIDLLREQQHRIRNNFQLIVAMLQRSSVQTTDPKARSSFRDIERRVFAMASLYDHLLGLGAHGENVDLGRYLASMADSFNDFYSLNENAITLEINLQFGICLALDVCTAVGTVVNEVVANAVEHAFNGDPGRIKLGLRKDAPRRCIVSIEDDGRGFNPNAEENIGIGTIRRIAAQIGGRIDYRPALGHGTVCELRFDVSP